MIEHPVRYILDAFALGKITVAGYKIFTGISLFSIHGFAEEVFFYMGGFFSVAWLGFRAMRGWIELKYAQRKHDEDE